LKSSYYPIFKELAGFSCCLKNITANLTDLWNDLLLIF